MAPRGGTENEGERHASKAMERPRPGPTGIVNDSTWTGKDPRQTRRKGNRGGDLGEQRKRALCFVTLF
jgi:hypothetical protein